MHLEHEMPPLTGKLDSSGKAVAHGPVLWPWWLGYVIFVIYGSLVPLDYRPIPLDQAWATFKQIHLLNVGAGGRADWVANGVLYLPVGFLTASLLAGRERTRVPVLAGVGAVIFGVVLAVAVEFTQLAFPPRTVSLNDVLAETIGSVLGAGVAGMAAHRFRLLMATIMSGADRHWPRLLKAYALAYCAFSLFPYDFLLSMQELADKYHSDTWGWIWAGGGGRGGEAALVAKMLAEVLAVMPLGWLFAGLGRSPREAFGAGAALGAVIEFAQFFLVSGVAQGFSVLTRALGMWAGALAWHRRGQIDPLRAANGIRRFILPIFALYLLGLTAVNGWFEVPWRGPDAAVESLHEVHFLPFYYHYYTTEQAALLSLTSVCLMYAPLGVAAWALFLGPGAAAVWAAMTAVGIEISKLFLVGLHPDPTNVFLAGLAAWISCRLVRGVERLATAPVAGHADRWPAPQANWTAASEAEPAGPANALGRDQGCLQSSPEVAPTGDSESRSAEGLAVRKPGSLRLAGLALGLALVGWGVATFPTEPVLLGMVLAGYGLLLWLRPHYLWMVVPAALVLVDFAPWSGRFYFDEFDLLLLVSVSVGCARLPPSASRRRDPLFAAALALMAMSCLISGLRGMLPWHGLDPNALSNYYSPFNALRIAKGSLWAFLLFRLAGRFGGIGVDVRRLFGMGMVIGLAGTVAAVLWERAAFPGLFNFSDVYRVTGPFSQMHTGGADIECYLTAAVPFLALSLTVRRRWSERLLGLMLLVGACYAVMVTFSRVGYAGFAIALAVALMSGLGASVRKPWFDRLKHGGMLILPAAVALAVMVPVLLSPFAQERLSRVGEDIAARQAHWRDAMGIRDPGSATRLFGMGLGRFPEIHYWRSSEVRAAGYSLEREGSHDFLRLGPGSPLYIEQFVPVLSHQAYAVSLSARSSQGTGRIAVSICEKWLLTSARCVAQTFEVPGGQDWQELKADMQSGDVGGAPWYAFRPVKLSVNNVSPAGLVDVRQIGLADRHGIDLLANGNFSAGLDQWFFSTDVDLPWHIWSLPVAVLFDQGWLGIIAFGLFLVVGLGRAGLRAMRGDPLAGAVCAAGLGLVVIGSLDSIVDSPRILLLMLLLVAFGGSRDIRSP